MAGKREQKVREQVTLSTKEEPNMRMLSRENKYLAHIPPLLTPKPMVDIIFSY